MPDYDRFFRDHHARGLGPYTLGVYLLKEGHPAHHVRAALNRFHGKGLAHPPHIYALRLASAGALLAALIVLMKLAR